MLFTLDNTAESMERESLDVGAASVLKALDHAARTLHDVVVHAGQVSSFMYFLYPNHHLSVVPYSS